MNSLVTKIIVITSLLFLINYSYSQSFFNNFDNYEDSVYLSSISPDWYIFSNLDSLSAIVSSKVAKSQPNSIYLTRDPLEQSIYIYHDFDTSYSSGKFVFDADFFVEENKGGQLSINTVSSGFNTAIVNCFFLNGGIIRIGGAGINDSLLKGTYPIGEWFNLKLVGSLEAGLWAVFIDGNSIGQFTKQFNSIANICFAPSNLIWNGGNNKVGYYVDNVSISHSPIPTINGCVYKIKNLIRKNIPGKNTNVSAIIKNTGSQTIHSFDISYQYANHPPVTETVYNTLIPYLDTFVYTFNHPIVMLPSSQPISVSISNVNGQLSGTSNAFDSLSAMVVPVIPNSNKKVVMEIAYFCYSDISEYEQLITNYQDYTIPISATFLCNLANERYQNHFFPHGYVPSGCVLPQIKVDRYYTTNKDYGHDPLELFLIRVAKPVHGTIMNGAKFDENTRKLTVSLTYSFLDTIADDWKIECILTEDNVSDTYTNNYVARAVYPAVQDSMNLLPSNIQSGDQYSIAVEFYIPENWDLSQMHIIGLLINSNYTIDNASSTTIQEAINNGFQQSDTLLLDVTQQKLKAPGFTIYPNPTLNKTFIHLNKVNHSPIHLKILDMKGSIKEERIIRQQGLRNIPIDTRSLSSGTYIVSIQTANSFCHRKLIVY